MAGLWITWQLLQDASKSPGISVTVLEAAAKIGGRIQTSYDTNQEPILETGAWRIPSTHRRMLRLCKELGLELMPVESGNAGAETAWLEERCEHPPAA